MVTSGEIPPLTLTLSPRKRGEGILGAVATRHTFCDAFNA